MHTCANEQTISTIAEDAPTDSNDKGKRKATPHRQHEKADRCPSKEVVPKGSL